MNNEESLEEKIDKLRQEVPERARQLLSEKLKEIMGDKKQLIIIDTEAILYLNKDGLLWREPKEKYFYLIQKNSKRHKLIRLFSEQLDYLPASALTGLVKHNLRTFQSEVGKINKVVGRKLQLPSKLIEGARGSGYRLNPNYKIIIQ